VYVSFLLRWTGSGLSDTLTCASAELATTLVESTAVLLPGFASDEALLAVAVLCNVDPAGAVTLTTTVIVTEPPEASVPT